MVVEIGKSSCDTTTDRESGLIRARTIAFYLPQFHRIPENDQWWGPGFTEWTSVKRSRPFFSGQRQPQLPGELGYYDLLDPSVHLRQQELARSHGVSAFCYYAYWFNGRRLLEKPLELVLADPTLRSQFLLCWANENWTRTWDGLDREVLVEQRHDAIADSAIVDDLAPYFADPRYLRIDGKPIFLVYRASILDDPVRTTDRLRERAVALGIGELFLAMVQTFGVWDPRPLGFDAAVEFPPHSLDSDLFRFHASITAAGVGEQVSKPGPEVSEMGAPPVFDPGEWKGAIFSYPRLMEWAMSKKTPNFLWFRGAMPSWDNTPRRMERGSAYFGDDPDIFQIWLERVLHYTYLFNHPREWLVFINSWNEWGEGAYLEPDFELGRRRLQAVEQAMANTDNLAAEVASIWEGGGPRPGDLIETARSYFNSSATLAREELCHWFRP
jgi:O-antigen biosynthesis protein